jgi:uncharacterized membrane protein YkoI
MKKYIMLFSIGLAALSCDAQKLKDTDVPALVKEAFTKKFSDAKKVSWTKEGESEYEAEFMKNGTEYSANFNAQGNWLETETEIKEASVPQAVRATISKEFPGYKIEEVEMSETAENGTAYEFELEKKELSYEVLVSKDGKVIKKEEKKEDKD